MQARLTKASIKTLPRVSPVSPLCPSEKTKTGKTPCAGCKMSLASHECCSRLKIPRASSGILRRLHHPPVGFCIRRKAINKKNKPFLYDKEHFLRDKKHFLRDKKHFLRDSDPFLCDSDVV